MESTTKVTRKYEKVVDAIKGAISRGELAYGGPLPPERKLIDELGVSRGSLREAFSVLELLGLIESLPGKGRFVRHPQTFSGGSDSLPLGGSAVLDLMEARRVLDPAIAGEAARKASPSDITRIRRVLSSTRAELDARAHRAQSDFDFHLAMAEATHNFIFVNIVRMEFNLIMATHEMIYGALEDKLAFVDEHENLYEAILDHDVSRASGAATMHIERIYKTLMSAVATQQR
ncbi:MAG: FadR family transcriptional regulator [Synergistaceae bacterium]|jgi:GntR family transcriptional repressor for pyruvate dehydrogenase complex|nr:FadR family transcriptional regulator [Synergistaceae bacterium]